MSRIEGSEHDWFRSRVDARQVGLLEESEEQRYEAHLQGCDACRALHDGHRELAALGEEWSLHIPSSVVARWPEATRSLRGLERQMVEEHLASCGECREDLTLLGHAPSLDVVHQPSATREFSIIRTERKGYALLVAWGTLATAAALAFAFRPALWGGDQSMRAVPIVSLLALRGPGEPEVNVVALAPDRDSVLLTPSPMPIFAAEEILTARLVPLGGSTTFEAEVSARDVARGGGLLVPTKGLRPGPYLLEFRSRSDLGKTVVFRLEVAASPR